MRLHNGKKKIDRRENENHFRNTVAFLHPFAHRHFVSFFSRWVADPMCKLILFQRNETVSIEMGDWPKTTASHQLLPVNLTVWPHDEHKTVQHKLIKQM